MKPLLLLIGLSLTSFSYAEIIITNAWVRAMPPRAKNTAAYMDIRNTSNQALTLIGFKTSNFEKIHSHKTTINNGIVSMDRFTITVPAQGEIKLQPLGIHLMLMQPKIKITNSEIIIDLLWSNGSKTIVIAPVK